jgi:serine/threonine protein kinase
MHILDESEIEKTFVERDPVVAPILPVPSMPPQTPRPVRQLPPSPARPLVGQTRIGFGLVVDAVGSGGMASVYKVWNERLELFRAVKMLSLDALHARFETEAKLSAKLRHPHIVEVYGVGEWNGVPYIEMEYVDGSNLQEALEARGRFPDAVCCAAGICIASALDYAHTLKFTLGGVSYDGLIHRDLKPANVLVSARSGIKLTDFGIARPAQAGLHTMEGNIVGTLHYLSPEQLGGGNIDRRSDIYSFGAILYEMATGVKAFPQKSITELTLHRTANKFKMPDEYDIPVPRAISDIILKCLKTSPEERYTDAAELTGDLRRAYAAIAPKRPPQKTLCDFFSDGAADAGVTPTSLITVEEYAEDESVNANEELKNTEETVTASSTGHFPEPNEALKTASQTGHYCPHTADAPANNFPPVKWPISKKAVIYASITVLALLSAFYLTVVFILIPQPQPKIAAKQSAAANFFAAPGDTDTSAVADKAGDRDDYPYDTSKSALPAVKQEAPAVDNAVNTVNTIRSPSPPNPAVSEAALIRSASEASGNREWDRVIRLLEKNGAVFTERRGERYLLLLEACVESRQLDMARPLLDSAAQTGDALYFLTAGRYSFYRGDYAGALRSLEASLTRSSALRSRGAVAGEAMFYIALVRGERFKVSPTDANRALAKDAWRRVKSAYESKPEAPQFKRAEAEILELY